MLNTKSLRYVVITSLILIQGTLFSAALKKVLILDFINIDKKASYQYLEASITDEVKKQLRKNFAFKESNSSLINDISAKNYLIRKDYYTYSAAMNLGLLTKQDLVISGGFRIEKSFKKVKKTSKDDKKKKSDKVKIVEKIIIVTEVQLLDITSKKVLASFTKKGPADARIFKSIKKIAKRITKEAAAVLPNKDDWARQSVVEEETLDSYNQLSLFGGYQAMSLTSVDSLSHDASISSSNFQNVFAFGFEYQRFGIIRNAISMYAQLDYGLSKSNLSYEGLSGTVPATLSNISGILGLAYKLPIGQKLYTQIFAGGGGTLHSVKLNFADSDFTATNTSGVEESLKEYSSFAPILKTGLRFGYLLTPAINLELGGYYQQLFYSSASDQSVSAEFRVGFFI